MKPLKNNNHQNNHPTQGAKRATKLTPNKKSGKDRHQLFQSLNNEENEFDNYYTTKNRESILDYLEEYEP